MTTNPHPSRSITTPNILMIMTDQHHAACLGHQEHPDVKTPALDRLAVGGVRFNECFSQNGVCLPSRVSYMTGQYVHTHGVYGSDHQPVPTSLLSLPRYLQTFNYQTAMIGKKHMPNWGGHGFQYERLCYNADAPTRALHYYNYLKQHNLHHLYDDLGDVRDFCLTDGETVPLEHSLEVWTGNEAITYLEDRDCEKPFFAQVSFERPHPPLTLPEGCPFIYDPASLTLPANSEEVLGNSPFFFNRNVELEWCTSVRGEKRLREALAVYYSLISLIDQQVGRILDYLEQLGIRQNTIIVFCADHGDFGGEYSRMAKGWNYDAIHRVPFIWNWQGQFAENKAHDELVETIDMFPTLCALLGVNVPPPVQGKSLASALKGGGCPARDAVFYEYLAAKTVRTKAYKLSYGYDGEKEIGELFDLVNDPHEYVNLFENGEAAPVREKLLRRLLDWQIETQQPPNFGTDSEDIPSTRWFREYR